MTSENATHIGQQVNPKHLEEVKSKFIEHGENMFGIFHGQALSDGGYGPGAKSKGGLSLHDYLIVTNKRVIMWARGIFSGSTDSFYFNDISSVEEARGLLTGEIVINVRGSKERMRNMVKSDVLIAAKMIRELISENRNPPRITTQANQANAPSIDIPDQIKKLADLRAVGILTEEEFTMKKNELLSRL